MAKQKKSSFRGKVKQDSQRQGTEGSDYGYLNLGKDVKVYTAKPGSKNNLLDIIPYIVTADNHPDRVEDLGIAMKGDLWYKRPFKIHRDVGSGKDVVVCPRSMGKKCPICEYQDKLRRDGADKETIKALYPKKRNLYVVIPLNSKDHEEVPHIWDMSQYLFQNLLNDEVEEDENNEIFPDLEEGLTLKIRFSSETFGNSKPYAEAKKIEFVERDEAYDEEILDSVPDLDSVLKVLSYKELELKFFEMDDEDATTDDDFEEAEVEVKKPSRKKKINKPEPVEDDEDGEEQAPPARKKKQKPEPEPEEDEDEEDEEEEEEAPKSAPKKAGKKSGDKCPHGLRYGVDTDTEDICDPCDLWDKCSDEKEGV